MKKRLLFIALTTLFFNFSHAQTDINLQRNIAIENDLISYKDVSLSLEKSDSGYIINFLDKYSQPLSSIDFIPFKTGNIINTHLTDSRLSYLTKVDYTQLINSQVIIDAEHSSHSCEALYVTYHLIGDNNPITQAFILDENGDLVSEMDQNCPLVKLDSKDKIGYIDGNYTAGFYWAQPVLTIKKPVSFNAIVSYEGNEIIPPNIQSYAFSKNFTSFYEFSKENKNQHPLFGTKFTTYINIPQEYNFMLKFNDAEKEHYFLNKAIVQ